MLIAPRAGGSCERPFSEADFRLADTARGWADKQVSAFFAEWCEITGEHPAYGVESWEFWGNDLRLVQDTSCRGCHNTRTHRFPAAWLFATGEDRAALILGHAREQERLREEREGIERQREVASLRHRLDLLSAGG